MTVSGVAKNTCRETILHNFLTLAMIKRISMYICSDEHGWSVVVNRKHRNRMMDDDKRAPGVCVYIYLSLYVCCGVNGFCTLACRGKVVVRYISRHPWYHSHPYVPTHCTHFPHTHTRARIQSTRRVFAQLTSEGSLDTATMVHFLRSTLHRSNVRSRGKSNGIALDSLEGMLLDHFRRDSRFTAELHREVSAIDRSSRMCVCHVLEPRNTHFPPHVPGRVAFCLFCSEQGLLFPFEIILLANLS